MSSLRGGPGLHKRAVRILYAAPRRSCMSTTRALGLMMYDSPAGDRDLGDDNLPIQRLPSHEILTSGRTSRADDVRAAAAAPCASATIITRAAVTRVRAAYRRTA